MADELDGAADYCYITTTGRVTGKPHTIEIWFGLEGRTLYVLAGGGQRADFVRNAMKQPNVTVRIGTRRSRELTATARIVTTKREDALARAGYCSRNTPATTTSTNGDGQRSRSHSTWRTDAPVAPTYQSRVAFPHVFLSIKIARVSWRAWTSP